jgi:hypothetical protein
MKNCLDVRMFVLELCLYGVLVSVYLLFVLKFLSGWLTGLFHEHRSFYAFVSLLIMITQAVVLERLTSLVLTITRRRSR